MEFSLGARRPGAKDVYGALSWAADQMAPMENRKAAILFTDGRDRRLSPRWFGSGSTPVLDPLFGLPDEAELRAFHQTLDVVAASGLRFFFVWTDTGGLPESGVRSIDGPFPGLDQEAARYIQRVLSRMEQVAGATGGGVLRASTLRDGLSQYGRLHQDFGLGIRYSIEFNGNPDSVRHGGVDVRARDPRLEAVGAANIGQGG